LSFFTFGNLFEAIIAAVALVVIGVTWALRPGSIKDRGTSKWFAYVFGVGFLFLAAVNIASWLINRPKVILYENGRSSLVNGSNQGGVSFRSGCASLEVLNAEVGACPDGRRLRAEQVAIIRSTVKPGAIIIIIPLVPGGPQDFAHDLAVAFSSVPDVKVSVETGNLILNGSRGLMVQFDHSNPVSISVFEALQRTGLDPKDLSNISGPEFYLKVAPE
jgi:hypothetical protein